MSAHNQYLVIILSLLITLTLQDITDNKIDRGNDKYAENLENLGGMVKNFIQSDSGKEIIKKIGTPENIGKFASVLGNLMKDENKEKNSNEINPLDILSAIGSISNSFSQSDEDGSNPNGILQGIGSILGGEGGNNVADLLQGMGSILDNNVNSESDKSNNIISDTGDDSGGGGGGGGDGGAALLAGLGSLLAAAGSANQNNGGSGLLETISTLIGQNQGQGQNGINIELIGSLIKTFTSSSHQKNDENKKRKVKKHLPEKKPKKTTQNDNTDDSAFNLNDIINLATMFLSQGTNGNNGGGGGLDFTHYLSMIINTISAFTGPDAEQRANSHLGHSKTTPTIFETFHLFFDNFLHSDMAKQILNYIGNEKAFKVFKNQNGEFQYEKFEQLIENHSFRKHWIKQIAGRLVDLLNVLSTTNTQNEYISTGLTIANSYLKSNGFPSSALINLKTPVKSLTNFGNFIVKKYFNLHDIDTKIYVEPSVTYIENLLNQAKESLKINEEPIELIEQISNTINMEVIEPIVRVNRAYRYVRLEPKCDRYILCLINQQQSSSSSSSSSDGALPSGVKKWLSKGPSLIAAWYLSTETGTSYWQLYSDIIEDKNCQRFYHKNCNGFHEEEIKVTTEYIHSEL